MSSREDLELWAAARVVTEHAAGGTCNRCDPDGCRLYRWADVRLRQWEEQHSRQYDGYAPSWQAARDPRQMPTGRLRCG